MAMKWLKRELKFPSKGGTDAENPEPDDALAASDQGSDLKPPTGLAPVADAPAPPAPLQVVPSGVQELAHDAPGDPVGLAPPPDAHEPPAAVSLSAEEPVVLVAPAQPSGGEEPPVPPVSLASHASLRPLEPAEAQDAQGASPHARFEHPTAAAAAVLKLEPSPVAELGRAEPAPSQQRPRAQMYAVQSPQHHGLRTARHPGRSKRLIGDVVVDLGFADRETVEAAVASSKVEGKTTGQILLERGALDSEQLAQVIAERFGLDYIDLSVYDVDMGAANLLDIEAIRRYQAVPAGFLEGDVLLVAMADPTNVLTIDDIAMMTNRRVKVAVAAAEDIKLLITRLASMEQSIGEIVEEDHEPESQTLVEEADPDAPVIKLVRSIIGQAVTQGASDIHINPEEHDTRVLFRVDGVLYPAATVRRRMSVSMVSRIKIMADLDISERRAPQDGRFAVTVENRRIDIRVVTLPLVHGEGAVMRLLDKGSASPELEHLGMPQEARERLNTAVLRPNGAVLVTGPTGSGKSTTLYAALHVLNDGARSILTIEDPVESRLPGVKQMQIAPKAGVTFESGLRSMLRADPDVIMVGEIRDQETAHIAVEAALTGHMVLSTLHTRDAPSALGRLADMGIEPFLISAAVDCIVAQRLVRVLCPYCKEPMKVSDSVLESHGLEGSQPYEAVGCPRCGGSGYRGRTGLYEVMTIGEEIRGQILERASVDEIAATAVRNGMCRLREDGMDKVREGVTSIAEVERMAASLL